MFAVFHLLLRFGQAVVDVTNKARLVPLGFVVLAFWLLMLSFRILLVAPSLQHRWNRTARGVFPATERPLMADELSRFQSRFQVAPGMVVIDRHQEQIGTVGEVRDTDFLVERPGQRGVYISFDHVQEVQGNQVLLSIAADQVETPFAAP